MENFSTFELLEELLKRENELNKGTVKAIATEVASQTKENAILSAMSTEEFMTVDAIAEKSGVAVTSVRVIISKDERVERKKMADTEAGKFYTVYKLK